MSGVIVEVAVVVVTGMTVELLLTHPTETLPQVYRQLKKGLVRTQKSSHF